MSRLKDPCTTCHKPLDPAWPICPFCETEVPGMAPTSTRRRRRRRSEEDDLGDTAAWDVTSSEQH
jgi:hypothetical protein